MAELENYGPLKTEQMKPLKFKSPIFFGPLREREGMLFVSIRHRSGKRLLVASLVFLSKQSACLKSRRKFGELKIILKVFHFL